MAPAYTAILIPVLRRELQSVCGVLFGPGAAILASIFGLAGSVCFAVPPIKNVGPRRALLLLARSMRSKRFAGATHNAEKALTNKMLEELETERAFNLAGAVLFCLAFLILLSQSICLPNEPTQQNQSLLGSVNFVDAAHGKD
ncbi:MAG: hypothetical protein MJE12_11820 [Alphaproteobacteria bacterium]|nr:hypothetical protein [Alphaproteobacteria bacterium]